MMNLNLHVVLGKALCQLDKTKADQLPWARDEAAAFAAYQAREQQARWIKEWVDFRKQVNVV